MTNREIRKAARKKAVAKGVTPVLFLAYAPSILLSIYNNLGSLGVSFQIHWVVWYAIQFAIILFSYAGGARASLAVWERGEARVRDLTAYFVHGRLLLRALVVAVLTTALNWGGTRLTAWIPAVAGYLPALLFTFLLVVFILSLNYLYYAIELGEGVSLWRTLLSGIGKIAKSFFRIVGMAIALWWWVILITAVVLGIAMYNLPRVAAASILVVLLALVYWFLGPYFRLSAAGLAIEIFRGKDAAEDESEEEGPVAIQMGSREEYEKRKEEAYGAREE
jgi:hypothetical protein